MAFEVSAFGIGVSFSSIAAIDFLRDSLRGVSVMGALYLIGCGTPTPTPQRFGTCYVLDLGEDKLMFDCGPATTYKLVRASLFPTQIDWLFFTHHHFDHNADYPCFLLCRWDQSIGKEKTLTIFGPPPTELITRRLIGEEGAFVYDWRARVEAPVSQAVHRNRGGSLPRPQPKVDVREVGPGLVVEKSGSGMAGGKSEAGGECWRVTAARAEHVQPWLESLAYRVDWADGSIAFAGDTQPCDGVIELARGADVLVVNCWDHQQTMESNGEAPGQTGTIDAAEMAKQAGVKKLVLTHTGPALCEPGSKEKAIADISRIYDGEIIFGEELMVVEL